MEKLSKELVEKIKELLKEDKAVEAVSLVQSEMGLGLRKSKEIVDLYR